MRSRLWERSKQPVQVGVNYQQYSQLVIDAKAAVNDVERTLPPCEMRTNLTEAMTAYEDADTVWEFKISDPNLALDEKFGHGEIITHYKLPLSGGPGTSFPPYYSPKLALPIIWSVGTEKLAKARSLQQK